MGESELPDIYLNDDQPVEEPVEEYRGRGARERTRVKYDDGLTEEQWLMAVDDDEDTIEDAIKRKNARIEKRQTNKEKRSRVAGESSPEPSRQSSEEPQPKKRSRKSGGAPKRKAEEEPEEPPQKKKRGRVIKPTETLSASQRATIQKIIGEAMQTLEDLDEDIPGEVDEDGEPVGRSIIEPFRKLVPKAHFPDYYMIIKDPIAFEHLQQKFNRHAYQSIRAFVADVRLLCNNCRTYNEDSSLLFQDANLIEVRRLTTSSPPIILSLTLSLRLRSSTNSANRRQTSLTGKFGTLVTTASAPRRIASPQRACPAQLHP